MVRVERSITIERPLADVFAYLCDREHPPQCVSARRAARQTSAGLRRLPESLAQERANERVSRDLAALNPVLAVGNLVAKSTSMSEEPQ